jgi:hypothetical protein
MLSMAICAGWSCQDMFFPEGLPMHTYLIYIIDINVAGSAGLRNMLLVSAGQGIGFIKDIMGTVTILAGWSFDID